MNILFCSCGNDSIALIQQFWEDRQTLIEYSEPEMLCDDETHYVVYQDTGWAAPFWQERVEETKALCKKYGFNLSP